MRSFFNTPLILVLFLLYELCLSSSCQTENVPIQQCSKHTYLVSSSAESWFRANIICKNIGMELVSINSEAENQELAHYLQLYSSSSTIGNGYWTSGSRYGSGTSDFVWWNSGTPVVYRKFSAKQPDNAGNKEYCIEVFEQNNGLLWNDYVCDVKLKFICQT